uniref:Uncharacterized protein n=1 Tax=Romanomermis culicivorax TaxID=13658 RepID=A0A915KYK1_ROMCU
MPRFQWMQKPDGKTTFYQQPYDEIGEQRRKA